MQNIERFIMEKVSSLTISVTSMKRNCKEEYSYEEFKENFINYLTPNDLTKKTSLKEKHNNETKESDFGDKLLNYFEKVKQEVLIKDLKLERSLLYIEFFSLSNDYCTNYEIMISSNLQNDEQFTKILFLIIKTFETNRIALIKEFEGVKKERENQELFKESIDTYFNSKKNILVTFEEAIVIENIIHNNLEDCWDIFDREYRGVHPLKVISIFGIPIIVVSWILNKELNISNDFLEVLTCLLALGGTSYLSDKITRRISYSKFMEFKRSLEEKYNFSYDLDERKIAINYPFTFYYGFPKCLKSTLELAYGKITTSLTAEINGLKSLLTEFEKNYGINEQIYFITRLLAIKKQILLKESTIDQRYPTFFKEVEFTKQFLKYLAGDSIIVSKMFLEDEKVKNILDKIEDYEKKKLNVFVVDLQMGLVEYIYENYLKFESKQENKESVEYDIDAMLERTINI